MDEEPAGADRHQAGLADRYPVGGIVKALQLRIAVDVSRDNATINGIRLGMQPGELLLAVADGMDSPMLAARAPFDLLIANILAGPLIELAPSFAKATASRGTLILAGLLDTQADGVAAAYAADGFSLTERGSGEWPILVLSAP